MKTLVTAENIGIRKLSSVILQTMYLSLKNYV